MSTLTILRGVSGSGKSTWAEQQEGLVVSRDKIRVMLFGSDGSDYYAADRATLNNREHYVTVVQNSMIVGGLEANLNVIVDNTNTEWQFVEQLVLLGRRHGATVGIKVFDIPLAQAIDNNALRAVGGGRDVGSGTIKRQHRRLQRSKDFTVNDVKS